MITDGDRRLLIEIVDGIAERTQIGIRVARQCLLRGDEASAADAYREAIDSNLESLTALSKRLALFVSVRQ